MIADSWWVVAGSAALAIGVYAVGAMLSKTRRVRPAATMDAYELAYLGGGRDRMIYTAVAQLRAMGIIEATDDGLIRAIAPLPHGAGANERAVHAAIADHHVTRSQLLVATQIDAPIVEVRTPRRTAPIPGLIMAGLAVVFSLLAVQRLAANGWRDGMGVAMGIVATLTSLSVPRFLLRKQTKIDPVELARSGRTGPTADQPALSVALYGPGAIWVIDREFAWRADIPPP